MVHVGEERCWGIVNYTAKDGTRKSGYWSTRIVEVKTISVINGKLVLKV
jgi:hypothetical protein